ncbi:hypothetical protein [Alicyclobacillus sp. SO9]|uniref:hypothetical protein n=1 Tax=Alicyclobacillus sp. SO9 TaxID=2665646 RepID=UPI0018E82875|nr:hypothetical protein [Alicyclobacillus sp. SO9]QQE79713.1 hypothetical protein GI364_04280 [Alicyclobacillus sp. SO9]
MKKVVLGLSSLATLSLGALAFPSHPTLAASTNSNPSTVLVKNNSDNSGKFKNQVDRVYSPKTKSSNFNLNANIIVVHRNLIPGQSTATLPGKYKKGKPDIKAFNSIYNSPYMQKLRNAYNNGSLIVLAGNNDGKLTDSLIYKLFNTSGAEEIHSSDFQALGLYKSPKTNRARIVAFNFNKKNVGIKYILKSAKIFYENNIAGKTTSSSIQPMSASTSQTGGILHKYNSNYYGYTNSYNLYESGWGLIGQIEFDTRLQRTDYQSGYSEWEVKLNMNTYPQNSSWQNAATWQGINNTEYYPVQKILQAKPGTQNSSYNQSVSANVNLSPMEGGTGSISFGTQWNYTISSRYVQLMGTAYKTDGWNTSYKGWSGPAEYGDYEEPGFTISNTAGDLVLPLDHVLSMRHWMGKYWYNATTGDQYDTIIPPAQ